MAISSNDSPPLLSEGSTASPESDDNENEDDGTEDDGTEDEGNEDDSNDLIDLLFSTAEKKAFLGDELGSWLWRSSKHPTKGFVREKVLGFWPQIGLDKERAGKFRKEKRSQFQLNFDSEVFYNFHLHFMEYSGTAICTPSCLIVLVHFLHHANVR
jgi:hypothetical protein